MWKFLLQERLHLSQSGGTIPVSSEERRDILIVSLRCSNAYQPGIPDYQQKVGGECKNITKMYTCHVQGHPSLIGFVKDTNQIPCRVWRHIQLQG